MDPQLAAEAVRVLRALEPTEYCFLWIQWWPFCQTKAEWAAWMQLFSTAFALGVAVWAVREPIRYAAEQREATEKTANYQRMLELSKIADEAQNVAGSFGVLAQGSSTDFEGFCRTELRHHTRDLGRLVEQAEKVESAASHSLVLVTQATLLKQVLRTMLQFAERLPDRSWGAVNAGMQYGEIGNAIRRIGEVRVKLTEMLAVAWAEDFNPP